MRGVLYLKYWKNKFLQEFWERNLSQKLMRDLQIFETRTCCLIQGD